MELKHHGPFRRKDIQSYISLLSKKRESPIYDSTVTAILRSSGYSIPEDPASVYDPDQLWTQLSRYYEKDVKLNRTPEVLSGIGRAFRAFGFRGDSKLSVLESESEIKDAIKLDKSAGIYQASKLEVWDEGYTRAHDILSRKKAPNPCLVGVRTQRNNKTRLVWMYPLDMTILEAKFARPLIEKFKLLTTPMPYAKYRVEVGSRIAYTMDKRNKVALDFSKFDSSVSADLIRIGFSILRTWFGDFSEADQAAWDCVLSYFIRTPIVMHDGNIYRGKQHGVPSGSYFTQLIDSIVNYIIINSAMVKFDFHPNENCILVLGDDSVFSTNADVNLAKLRTYFEGLGFSLNVEKSMVTNDVVHFIGFDWDRGLANKPLDKAISIMTQPEKWRKRAMDRSAEAVRAFRLISNVAALGVNLYEIYYQVFNAKPINVNYIDLGNDGSTGYLDFIKDELDVPNFWRSASSAVFI